MKFTIGDYIRYTKENEQEVIEGLIGMGYEVSKGNKGYGYDKFINRYGSDKWGRCRDCHKMRGKSYDRTNEFFSYLSKNKSSCSSLNSLPSKFYIDCGDRIEVREWLHGMGFEFRCNRSLLSENLSDAIIYIDKKSGVCYFGVYCEKEFALVKPKLTVTSFEVEPSESDKARNKELESLKQAHKELGERIDRLYE